MWIGFIWLWIWGPWWNQAPQEGLYFVDLKAGLKCKLLFLQCERFIEQSFFIFEMSPNRPLSTPSTGSCRLWSLAPSISHRLVVATSGGVHGLNKTFLSFFSSQNYFDVLTKINSIWPSCGLVTSLTILEQRTSAVGALSSHLLHLRRGEIYL